MTKRKRGNETSFDKPAKLADTNGNTSKVAKMNGHVDVKTSATTIQIVAGSYERVLHGITASISDLASKNAESVVQFTDNFLFNAHASAIKCLALSPLPSTDSTDSQSVFLATGGSDERINLYSLSTVPLADNDRIPSMPTLGSNKISENPRNRELGSLMQHSASVSALYFPTRSKLLSASEDNTISISRVKDLTTVSTIKAPHPKAQGQPSGDTAPQGIVPAGVNDFAIHPSMKLMVSVGRGEKCMRLWNLVTGRKAGVLNFSRDLLQAVKEGKYSSGEGRKIRWHPAGNEFAVAFERGTVIFGADSEPKRKILPVPLTKLHQINYVTLSNGLDHQYLTFVVSTEDGRILFYEADDAVSQNTDKNIVGAKVLAELDMKAVGVPGRIKDFEILSMTNHNSEETTAIVTASSNGSIRIWHVALSELVKARQSKTVYKIETLIGTYETGNRITCLKAFVMSPAVDDELDMSEFEGLTADEADSSSESEAGI